MTRLGWCPGRRTVPDMLALYPGTSAVRIFVGPDDQLPAWDGPILRPALDAGALVHLSFKRWDLPALEAWLSAMPDGPPLILTYHHEPEQGESEGDPPLDVWRARWAELVTALADHPRRGDLRLVPTYTRFWWQKNAGDQRWLFTEGVDGHAWDVYNNGLSYRSPDDLLSIPRAISAQTGLPYLIAELGALRQLSDSDGSGRTAWMRAMVAAAQTDGAWTVCWYHKEGWDLAATGSEPEQQTWRELIQEDPMPTYAQLQAETWWGREVTTPAMDWLGDELCRRTGRPREAAGTKGDNHHLRGAHRSQEWIQRSMFCTNRSYTVQAGLTDEQRRHVAGFDFTPGSAEDMIAQCKRLLTAMQRGELDEVREMYGNVDGDQVVDGWDNVADRAASSDSSHLWHWHLSIDRRHCNDQALMERILAIALGEDIDMIISDADKDDIAHRAMQQVLGATLGKSTVTVAQVLQGLGGTIAREGTSPTELAAALAALPQPAPVDVDQIAAATAQRVLAALPDSSAGPVSREDLEAALRDVLGSLNDAPQG